MKFSNGPLYFAMVIFCIIAIPSHAGQSLCPNITLRDGSLNLDSNERILVCGSTGSMDGWHEVPLPQAVYQLTAILQNRGYLNSRFERDHERLSVWLGPISKTKQLLVTGGNSVVVADQKRKIVGYPATPEKLDEVTNWAELKFRRNGFGCPKIDVNYHAWDGVMIAKLDSGQKMTVGAVERSGFERLDEAMVSRRFDAFKSGDPYNVIETEITISRMLAQGLFQTAYFTSKCNGDKIDLHLHAGIGKPRLLRFLLGASTEEFPFAEISYKDTLIDDRASSYTANLRTSPIRQTLNLNSELYWIPGSMRSYLGPRLKVERREERAYLLQKMALGGDLARDWDLFNVRLQGRVGPTFNYEKTIRGIGPKQAAYVSWNGSLNLMSHSYEAFLRTQFEGWSASFNYQGQRDRVGSSINVDRYDLELKHLWNIGAYSPPLFVLATRIEAVGVDTRSSLSSFDENLLPIDYRIFYGGDQNLRGFSRESLNNSGLGYLTALYTGLELRLIEELPYHLEPFLLWDFGRLGSSRYSLNSPIFTAHGFGLRWASPFGTLRGSAARGQIWDGDAITKSYQEEWVYYLSFGQEF